MVADIRTPAFLSTKLKRPSPYWARIPMALSYIIKTEIMMLKNKIWKTVTLFHRVKKWFALKIAHRMNRVNLTISLPPKNSLRETRRYELRRYVAEQSEQVLSI